MSFALKMIKAAMKLQPSIQLGEKTDYAKNRAIIDNPKNQIGVVKTVKIEPATFGGAECEILTPEKVASDSIIFFIHGGGYAYGSVRSSRGYASVLADEMGMRVITITYHLAPENRWPAGIDDCFAAYKEIAGTYKESQIALAGESAGGTMVLVTALRAKDAGIRLPSCVAAFSPCTNMAEDLPSRKKNEGAMVLPYANAVDMLREIYLDKDTDPKNPYVSPYFGDYTGFPPVYFTADRGEVLFDDTDMLVPKVKAAGVEVEYDIYEDTFHSFPTLGRVCPESTEALEKTKAFLLEHLI